MQNDNLEKGQSWVQSQLERLADDAEMEIADSIWSQSNSDRDRNVHTLSFRVGDNPVEEKFTHENLMHVISDRKVRARMEHRLKAVFRACGIALSEEDDDVLDETERDDRGIEFRYSITSYGADYPVDSLVRRLSDGDIFIPPFQRKFVWSRTQSSKFVESLLLGLPVPAIFLGKEEETNKLLVVDGQQRLRSLWHFCRGKFEDDQEFTLTGVASRFEGLSYRTLPESDRRRLNDSILHAIVVRQDQPEEDHNSSIYLLFERLNTGGSLLHPQEIRACVYHGPLNDLLAELNQDPSWRAVYGPENQRMKDRELILRFFTLLFDLDRYSRPMEGALNHYMGSNRKLQRHTREQLIKSFVPTIQKINDALGTIAFRPIRAINAAVFDGVMVGLAKRLGTVPNADASQVKTAYLKLLEHPDFKNAYESSTAAEEKVRDRIRLAGESFAEIH
jgi:hypothetical protein